MSKTTKIPTKIICPSKIILNIEADMVNIPGSEGVFGVLPGHGKFISIIDSGIIVIFSGDDKIKYFTYGGVAKIDEVELNIITDFAVDLDNINRSEINSDIESLKENLKNLDENSSEFHIFSEKIKRYEKLLSAI